MTKREERRNIARLTINTDDMYYMGLDIPYNNNVEVFLDNEEIQKHCIKDNGEPIKLSIDLDSIRKYLESISDESTVINTIKENGMIENQLLFKRWVCAQTFRMLNYKGIEGNGWDAYMKEKLTYSYQFNMLIDEIKRLAKMERDNGHDFEIESKFWTFNTIQQIYRENLINVVKFFRDQLLARRYVVSIYLNNGRKRIDSIKNIDDINAFIYPYSKAVDSMSQAKTYSELLQIIKRNLCNMPVCPRGHEKCRTWKSIYRGYGGFYTLYNLIGWHGITFKDMNMEESLEHLEDLLNGEMFYNPWKFHYVLKDVIKENDFNLSDSIKKINRMRIS